MRNRLQYSRLTEGQAINTLSLSGIHVDCGERMINRPGLVKVTAEIEDAYRSLRRRGYKVVDEIPESQPDGPIADSNDGYKLMPWDEKE